MSDSLVYKGLTDVISEDIFAEVDCRLRKGEHIGLEDMTAHDFIKEASPFLSQFYRKYSCQLIHDTQEEADFFFLHPYDPGSGVHLLGRKQLSQSEMIVGMTLAYMLMDPEYMSKKVPFERLIFFLKRLLADEGFYEKFAPRSRGKDALRDEENAEKEVSRCLHRLRSLGFVAWPGKDKPIVVKSPIFRFIAPIRGMGNLEQNIQVLLKEGLIESDAFVEEGADEWSEGSGEEDSYED